MKDKRKLVILVTTAIVVIAAVSAVSVHFFKNRSSKVVDVYSMDLLNNAGMYGEESELSGTISSDYVQEVYPNGSEDVSEVFVKQGDTVKEGDNLLQYNVEEEKLDLQLQELQIKASKMDIERMEKQLQKMKGTRTKGSLDSSGNSLMNASVDMSDVKDKALSTLLGKEEQEENTEAATQTEQQEQTEGKEGLSKNTEPSGQTTAAKVQTDPRAFSVTSLDQASGEGSAEKPYLFDLRKTDAGEEPTISGSVLNQLSKNNTREGAVYATFKLNGYPEQFENIIVTPDKYIAGKPLENQAYTYSQLAGMVKVRQCVDSVSGLLSGKTVYFLYKNGTVSGKVLKKIMADDAVITFQYYDTEDAYEEDKTAASVTLRPVYVADAIDNDKDYSFSEIEKLSQSTYRNKISDVQADCAYGDGTSDSAYVYNLCKGGTIKGSVIKEIIDGDSSAIFYTYSSEADIALKQNMEPTVKITASTPSLLAVKSDGWYTVSDLKQYIDEALASIELVEKIESIDDAVSGKGDAKSPYIFKMLENGQIKGSVINEILKKKGYAAIGEYELNKDGSTGELLAVINIRPNTVFKENISSLGWYSITDLNNLLVMADRIEIRPARKTVTAGRTYKFSARVTGRNADVLTITWELKNNKSDATAINNGNLVVASTETADTLRIIARAGEKKAVLVVKVKGGYSDDDYSDDDSYGGGGGGYSGGDDYSNYTATELKEAILDKEAEIAEAKQELKEAKINYKEAKKQVDAATVKAKVNGEVTLAYTKEAMPNDGSPAIVVRSDDGMYVNVNVSEMALDTVKVGGTIKCTSWDTGEEYEAVVKEVSEYPTSSQNYYDTSINPNNSYYPVVAYIEDAGELTTGDTVNVTYDSQSMGTYSDNSICIQKAYIRSENKRSYVYKEGKNGRLEKQYVKTGSIIYGQYVEILAGLTTSDNLAFPYGKNVKEGAKVRLSDNADDIIY